MIRDLGLDQPPVDPTTLTGEELVAEVQRVVKALLGYGARMPKELMLYVKNMVFLDGAIARLAPDLDLLAEIASISMMFAERHGERLGKRARASTRPACRSTWTGSRPASASTPSTDSLTYRDLQAAPAQLIQKRMREQQRGARPGAARGDRPVLASTTAGGWRPTCPRRCG